MTDYKPHIDEVPPQAKDYEPHVDEVENAWLDAMKNLAAIKDPENLPPLQGAWVMMYCAAIESGKYNHTSAGEVADYGLLHLQKQFKQLRKENQNDL